jgi:hypothetical protein
VSLLYNLLLLASGHTTSVGNIVRFVILALILYVHVYFSVGVFPPIDWDWLVTQRTHWHPCILGI